MSDDLQRELEHESACLDEGAAKYRNRIIKNRVNRSESRSDYGKRLVSRCVEPLSKAIGEFLVESVKGGAGRRHLAATLLPLVPPDVEAFIACRIIFDGITQNHLYQRVAVEIGGRIEEEFRFAHFEKTRKPLYNVVQESIDTNPVMGYNPRTRARVLTHAMNKFKVTYEKWSNQQKFHIGSKLIDLFVQSTGMVTLSRSKERKDTKITLQPTEELLKWIEQFTEYSELLCHVQQPCLIPPRPFTTPYDGGYHHERMRTGLVRTRLASQRGMMAELSTLEMPTVYASVNALQNTSWKISLPMLEIVESVWNSGLEVGGIPSKFDEEKTTEPEWDENDPEKKKLWAHWREEMAKSFRRNAARMSKRLALASVLHLSTKFKDEPAIYFPVRLDFRGRAYYVPPGLNPQGSDLAKALLTFAEGKPLGERGAHWLAVTVANHFGNDKVSLDDRAEWTRQNSDRIVNMANDPLADLWWTEADKPFQFLAACVEWVGYTTDGPDYICHLPVLVDGSCNGLQHFAAMLRDEVCGRHVNLVPSEKPGDIYTEVAKSLIHRLEQEVKTSTGRADWAQDWLTFGIDRKLCKRPTMVLPYGGTREAFAKYIGDHVREKGHTFSKSLKGRVYYLVKLLMEAMDEVIVGPRRAMSWLRDVAKIVSNEGLPITWTTPVGFLVNQSYPNLTNRRVATRVGESVMKFTLTEEVAGKLNRRKQITALSPNLVHSLDAAALMQTVEACHQQGIHHFHAVHDSYGTHAASMDVLAKTLRTVFVSMYQADDILMKFREEIKAGGDVKLPYPPAKGGLDLGGVILSPYFFA